MDDTNVTYRGGSSQSSPSGVLRRTTSADSGWACGEGLWGRGRDTNHKTNAVNGRTSDHTVGVVGVIHQRFVQFFALATATHADEERDARNEGDEERCTPRSSARDDTCRWF